MPLSVATNSVSGRSDSTMTKKDVNTLLRASAAEEAWVQAAEEKDAEGWRSLTNFVPGESEWALSERAESERAGRRAKKMNIGGSRRLGRLIEGCRRRRF